MPRNLDLNRQRVHLLAEGNAHEPRKAKQVLVNCEKLSASFIHDIRAIRGKTPIL
jgi:hypothetical protein